MWRSACSVVVMSAVALLLSVTGRAQQTAATAPVASEARVFEVAVVRANRTASEHADVSATPTRLTFVNMPLRFILLHAFGAMDHQLVNVPGWASTERFDVTGTFGARDSPNAEVQQTMLQALLRERFGLTFHREPRNIQVYALTVARDDRQLGPRLAPSAGACTADAPGRGGTRASTLTPDGRWPNCRMLASRRSIVGGAQTMPQLAASLQSLMRVPVVDRTALPGRYDLELEFDPASTAVAVAGTSPAIPGESPSMLTALVEQLGLRLQPARADVEVVIVDTLRRPDDN